MAEFVSYQASQPRPPAMRRWTPGDRLLNILEGCDKPRTGFLPREVMERALSQVAGTDQGDLADFTKVTLDRFEDPGNPGKVDYRKFVSFMLPGKGALKAALEMADNLFHEQQQQEQRLGTCEKAVQAMCLRTNGRAPSKPASTARSTPPSKQGSKTHSTPRKDEDTVSWRFQTWLNEHVSKVLAESLKLHVDSPDQELAFARALGYLDPAARKQVVLDLMTEDRTLEKLADCVVKLAAELVQAKAATGKELNDKFAASDGVFAFGFGRTAEFFSGLEDLIGSPSPNVKKAMEKEHRERKDSNHTWTTVHYGITTTPNIEWHFVVSPDAKPKEISGWPKETKNAENPRRPNPLSEYTAVFNGLNKRLEEHKTELIIEEMIGCRLYTGPMFEKYNAVNRGGARKEAKTQQTPYLVEKFEKLCKGNRYCTTVHVINSALIKLSKIQKAQTLYRGTRDGVLPHCFWNKDEAKVCGGIEFGFLSTSTMKEVAYDYLSGGKACTVLEIETGMIDRGADLEPFSQYPYEKEVCFPPLTGMEVLSSRVERHTLFVKIRLNVNFCALTIEQVIGKRHQVVKDMCDNLKFEAQTLTGWNLVDGNKYEEFVHDVVREAAEKDFDKITQGSPEQFNNDVILLSAVRQALDVSDSVKWQKSSVLRRAALELRKRAARYRLMRLVWMAAHVNRFKGTQDTGNQGGQQEAPPKIRWRSETLSRRHESALAAAEELEKNADINENVEFKDIDVVAVRREDTRRLGLSGGSARSLILEKLKLKEEDGIIYVNTPSELWPKMKPGYTLVDVNNVKGDPEGLAKAIVHEAGAKLTFRRPLEKEELTETLIKMLQDTTEGNRHKKKFLVERCLALNRQLNVVELRRISLPPEAGKVLAHAMKKNRTIQSLFMDSNKAGPDMAQELEHSLRQNKTIQTLDIRANELMPTGGMAIARALKENTTLHTLGVPRNELGPDGGTAIAEALKVNKGLQTLYIQGNKLGEKGGKAFGLALENNQTLSALHIDANDLGGEGGKAIAHALRGNRTLRRLWIPQNNLGEGGGKAIAEALQENIPLHSLGMAGNRIGVNAVEALAVALKANRNLTDLGIENNELGVAGGEQIAKALSDNKVLRTLRLKDNGLGDASCVAIAEALQKTNRSLTTLYIDSNGIGPEGARALAEALQANPTFQVLGIERNKIGSEGGRFLAGALERSTTLQTLWADGNDLGEQGGLALAKALNCNKSLETLGIKNNGLTKQVGKELASALEKNPTLLKLMITGDEVGAEAVALIDQKNQGRVNVDMK